MTADGEVPADVLDTLDGALLRVRRFVSSAPPRRPDPSSPDEAYRVELSTVLVVDLLARREDPVAVRDLAESLAVAHSTASRFVDRAEQAGVVIRRRTDADGRVQHVLLTPEGRALAERARAFRHARLSGLLEGWEPADVATFSRLLARFADRT
ncbi:MarR family winged helix-turn-helix transcriptional regulator [Cellulomonas sp. Y8]|uniref:MarR family winged helix-turn-helix transcriptional regulator n=1 Tax=Cellulomonas sp. Y8 TaxID=2591145 RepID=UPI003D754AF4